MGLAKQAKRMDAINVVLVALATWQLTELLHHSELTLPFRRWTAGSTQTGVQRSLFARGFNCPFCLSHWVAAAVLLSLFWDDLTGFGPLGKYLVWCLAAVRLANLGNDLAYERTRTPKFEVEEYDITIEDEPNEEAGSEDPATDVRG
jgi:hypothetical protein